MAKVIPFPPLPSPDRTVFSKGSDQGRGLFRFRSAEWETRTPAMVGLHQAALFEEHFEKVTGENRPVALVPAHVPLKGSLGRTIQGLYRARNDPARMRGIYVLAGMMELAIRQPHDLLRTDLIRRLFETIRARSGELNVRWSSDREGFLLPLPESLYPRSRLARELSSAVTYQDLLKRLEEEVRFQFTLSGRHFIYYLPRSWMV